MITSLSPFGSWYPIRKELFQVVNGNITCKPDYMRDKLSACNKFDQSLALEHIKDAYQNGTAKSGVIDLRVSNKAGVQILTGYFQDLGDIIFADNC